MLGLPIAVHLSAVKRDGRATLCGALLHFLLFAGGSERAVIVQDALWHGYL